MASRTQQIKIQRDGFFHAIEAGDARTAKILCPGFPWEKDDHKTLARAMGLSLAQGPESLDFAREAFPQALLGESAQAKQDSPPPTLPLILSFVSALRDSVRVQENGALQFGGRPEALSASCAAVGRWLLPLLRQTPAWQEASCAKLPGAFWFWLPEPDRKEALAQLGSVRAEEPLLIALKMARDGLRLSLPEALAEGLRLMNEQMGRFSASSAKTAKAFASRCLLREAAESGPRPLSGNAEAHWANLPAPNEPGCEAFKTRQAQIRPALIAAALREAAALAPLRWANKIKGEAAWLPTPLEAATQSLNTAAWAFLEQSGADFAEKSGAALLLSACGNWAPLPTEAGDAWGSEGRANPNDPFAHPHAPWAALSQRVLFELGARPLAALYSAQARTAPAPSGFARAGRAELPADDVLAAQSLARMLLGNNPLMADSACVDLLREASRGQGISALDQPHLLGEWLFPALAREGASVDLPVELLEKLGGKSQAILSAIAIERQLALSTGSAESESANARPSTRRL